MSTQEKNNASDETILVAENRKARFTYQVGETFECGLVLVGSEVKSVRQKKINFKNAYAIVKSNEVFLLGLTIEPYAQATHDKHDPDRTRKLLLKQRQIRTINRALGEKGATLVPLKIYFKRRMAKVLIGIAKGKSQSDKRQTIKKRESDIQISRVLRKG